MQNHIKCSSVDTETTCQSEPIHVSLNCQSRPADAQIKNFNLITPDWHLKIPIIIQAKKHDLVGFLPRKHLLQCFGKALRIARILLSLLLLHIRRVLLLRSRLRPRCSGQWSRWQWLSPSRTDERSSLRLRRCQTGLRWFGLSQIDPRWGWFWPNMQDMSPMSAMMMTKPKMTTAKDWQWARFNLKGDRPMA